TALAAPCRAVGHKHAGRAAFQPEEHAGYIMVLDRTAAAPVWALGVRFRHVGGDGADAPEQHPYERERMHCEIIERAVAGSRLAAPGEGRNRISHEVLVHLYAEMVDLADCALGQEAADLPDHRVLDVVVAEDRRLACLALRAAARMASVSPIVGAIGFSHQTCFPASSAAITISA